MATTSKEGSRRETYPILILKEIVTGNNNVSEGNPFINNWNEYNLNPLNEEQLEGKSGASSRGNSSSKILH